MLWACPVCPEFSRDPVGWFRFRLQVATEVDCIEWSRSDNVAFMAGLAAFTVGIACTIAWRIRAACRARVADRDLIRDYREFG